MKLVCLGDSLTFGYGVSSKDNWIHLLNKKANINVINKGANGDTTAGMLFRFYEDVILSNAEYVFIMGGTNDFLSNYKVHNVVENIKHMALEAKVKQLKVLIGIQPPVIPYLANKYWICGNYDEVNRKLYEYKKHIESFCTQNNIHYINFYKKFKEVITKDNVSTLYIDGIHLTPKGHELMAKTFIKIL